jgi:hypothetical protein
MPTETLQQIYTYLSPLDFNAARHTCRNWMRASLDKSLLAAMLSRAGWSTNAASCQANTKAPLSDTFPVLTESEEWILSRRLSRQCALASGWTGNGFEAGPVIVESSQVDFTDLTNCHSAAIEEQSRGLTFSTSVCGRFLLVARDTLIYVYDFWRGSPAPVTVVVCPRRVLSISMDASQGRHAVAAILEGRMGMICELHCRGKREHEGPQKLLCTRSRTRVIDSRGDNESIGSLEGTSLGVNNSMPCVQMHDMEPFTAIDVRSHYQSVGLEGVDNHRTHDRNLVNATWNLNMHGPLRDHTSPNEPFSRAIPIDCGASTFYRHLCSEDDPPRCVAVCPQRRCVAFGCSAGIELHWIDALTGKSLSR